MKVKLIIISIGVIALSAFIWLNREPKSPFFTIQGISMVARTRGDQFTIFQEGDFQETFLKGVNMGAAKPGTFPGELGISKEMYYQWFAWIHAMDADVIRVYTTLQPEFYEALYRFNQTVDRPIYIFQGVWLNEYEALALNDAFGDERSLMESFIQDAKDLVDIIHGQADLPHRPGFASGLYQYDVSPYVIGWILGVEWDPRFVQGTKLQNEGLSSYQGTFVSSHEEANPFEIFLAEVADRVIAYEVSSYRYMRPLSFVNWPTTDLLHHPNEPDFREDMVSVTMNHLIAEKAFHAGLFASYHIYPYYPEFMNYSLKYRTHLDHRGNINAYHGYLLDFISHYDIPVIVAEFGIPASRGKTHDDLNAGFNQGFIDEETQGHMVVHMSKDIFNAGYAGALVFTWQDEWFKRTWNTMDLDNPDRRPFWSNVQTNEQHFGLMAFDPGYPKRIRYVDDDLSDWNDATPILVDGAYAVFVASDERYLYIYVDHPGLNHSKARLLIPISLHSTQGNTHVLGTDLTFSHPIDFLVDIRAHGPSQILVDAYFDPFYFLYHEQLNLLPKDDRFTVKDSGLFNPIYQGLSRDLFLPQENLTVPFSKHLTGLL